MNPGMLLSWVMKKHPLSDALTQTLREKCPALLDEFVDAVYDNYDYPMKVHPSVHGKIMSEIRRVVARAGEQGMLTIGTLTRHEGDRSRVFLVVRSAPREVHATKIIYLP